MKKLLTTFQGDFWFIDESAARLGTQLRKVVALKGSKPVFPIRLSKEGVRIIGALRRSGQFIFVIVKRVNQETIKAFLRHLKRFKGKGRLYIAWDGDGSHTAHSVRQLASKQGIHLIQQAPYSPETQPVEEIWRQLKAYLANWVFEDIPHLIQTIERFFSERQNRFDIEVVNYFS